MLASSCFRLVISFWCSSVRSFSCSSSRSYLNTQRSTHCTPKHACQTCFTWFIYIFNPCDVISSSFFYYCGLIVQNIHLVEGKKNGSFLVFDSSSGCLLLSTIYHSTILKFCVMVEINKSSADFIWVTPNIKISINFILPTVFYGSSIFTTV